MSAFPYLNQSVRDLAWACFSPALLEIDQAPGEGQDVTACGLTLTPARRRWLEQLDRDPQTLLAHLSSNRSRRLGLYFEQLWHFFLAQDEAVELVAHNLPVREDGRTLGEFDVIYWCHLRQRHFHLELAVKFFLGYRQQTAAESTSQWQEWLGPNSNDRLDLKMNQLLHRQIRLGEQPAARALLAGHGIADMGKEIAIRGYLFGPAGDPLPPPTGFSSQLALSCWLPLDQLTRFLQDGVAMHFQLLPKDRWLTPLHADGQEELISRSNLPERLQSLLSTSRRARLVAGMGADQRELYRFFVTPSDWPAEPYQYTQETL